MTADTQGERRTEVCRACKGTGLAPPKSGLLRWARKENVVCEECDGTGRKDAESPST